MKNAEFYIDDKRISAKQLSAVAEKIRQFGREGDTVLAHISPEEAQLLKAMGGAESINPMTGLPEYKKFWKNITIKKAAPTIAATIAFAASGGNPAAAAAASAAVKAAQGASPEDIAKSAALTYIGANVAGGVGGEGGTVSGGIDLGSDYFAGDAVSAGASGATSAGTTAAVVPNAFNEAINTALGQTPPAGQFGSVGTAGFGTALPPASELSAGLTAAGFAPGTAANLAGETAAGTGATNLLGGATAYNPLIPSPTLSLTDVLRGARLAQGLMSPQQQQIPQQEIGNLPQGSVDYSQLLALLSQRARGMGLLGTQFRPQPINIASLLG